MMQAKVVIQMLGRVIKSEKDFQIAEILGEGVTRANHEKRKAVSAMFMACTGQYPTQEQLEQIDDDLRFKKEDI